MPKVICFESGRTSSGFGTWHAAKLDCGHLHYADYYQTFPASVAIGSEIECGQCRDNAKQEAWLEALDPKIVHHVRYRPRFGGTYTFYKFDPTSPSNFFNIGGTYATPAIDKILQRKGLSPISPTEAA